MGRRQRDRNALENTMQARTAAIKELIFNTGQTNRWLARGFVCIACGIICACASVPGYPLEREDVAQSSSRHWSSRGEVIFSSELLPASRMTAYDAAATLRPQFF